MSLFKVEFCLQIRCVIFDRAVCLVSLMESLDTTGTLNLAERLAGMKKPSDDSGMNGKIVVKIVLEKPCGGV